MELEDLKTLAAASLLGGSVRYVDRGRAVEVVVPSVHQIEAAVKMAGEIWDEVLKQKREGRD